MDDAIIVFQGAVEPGIIAAATDDNDVSFGNFSHIGSGRLEGMRVDVATGNNCFNVYIWGDSFGDVSPHLGGGDHFKGIGSSSVGGICGIC